MEPLEERRLLTAVVGDEIVVSEAMQSTGGLLDKPEVAMDSAGNFVVTWQARAHSSDDWDVYAQRYTASGTPLGAAFQVNTFEPGDQMLPRIAMSATGSFVITWQSQGQDGDGWGVFSQLYDQNGNTLGDELQVNTYTGGNQQKPTVAMNDSGQFVVAWIDGGSAFVRSYFADGQARTSPTSGVSSDNYRPAVGMDAAGNFVLAGLRGANAEALRFTADGVKFGGLILAGLDSPWTEQQTIELAMNSSGEFAIAKSRVTQLLARRFNREGIAQGELIEVRRPFVLYSYTPVVTDFGMAVDEGGNLTFAMMNALPPDNETPRLYVQRYDANGAMEHAGIALLEDELLTRHVSTAINNRGQVVVAWNNTLVTPRDQIVVQRLESTALRVTDVATLAEESFRPGEQSLTPVDGFYVKFSRLVDPASATNPANWQLLRGGIDISSQISVISYTDQRARITLTGALGPGKYALVARGTIHDVDGQVLDGDGDQTPGGDCVFDFEVGMVYPVGHQTFLNPPTTPPLPIATPLHFLDKNVQVASNGAGQVVAVWSRAGSTATIAQRLGADGQLLGPQIVIQSASNGTATIPPSVGMDAAGNFVVAWQSSPGTLSVRRYWADGTPRGETLSVPVFESAQVLVQPTGRYVVAYDGQLQFFAADGTAQGGVVPVGLSPPALAFTSEGELIAVGTLGGERIAARRFSPQGVPIGSPFYITEYERYSRNLNLRDGILGLSVAANPSGGFVVVWQRAGGPETGVFGYQYLSPDSNVYARVFGADARPLTEVFQVNTDRVPLNLTTIPTPRAPRVAFDSQGRFLVTWQSITADYSGLGIFARGYLADGAALDDQFRVNTITNRDQPVPAIVSTSTGDFLLAWSEPGIQAQRLRFGDNPLVLDLNGSAPGTGYAIDYFPGEGPKPIVDFTHLDIYGGSRPTLISATVRMDGALPGDLLGIDTAGTHISASFADGVISLTGIDSVENYERVLRSVTFTTAVATTATRKVTVTLSATDGLIDSTVARSTVTVAGQFSNSIRYRQLYSNQNEPYQHAYLPGKGLATFANVTGSSRGLIGFRIQFTQTIAGLTADDFIFRIGTNNLPETWVTAPAPAFVDGSQGYQLGMYWQDNVIQNTWLEVTVKATPRTRLAAPEVFYFGSLIGDTGAGNTPTMAIVNATDQLAIRSRIGTYPIPTYDLNGDGVINSTDELIARNHPGILRYLNLPPLVASATAQPATLASAPANQPELAAIAFALAGTGESGSDPQTAGVSSTAVAPLTDCPRLPAAAVAAVFSQEPEGAANVSRPPISDDPQDADIHAALGDVLAQRWEGR